MNNELIQIDLFKPLVPFIESIEVREIDKSTRFIIKKDIEVRVTILLPTNLKLDRDEINKYFIEGSVDYEVYMERGKRKIVGLLKDKALAEYLFLEHSNLVKTSEASNTPFRNPHSSH